MEHNIICTSQEETDDYLALKAHMAIKEAERTKLRRRLVRRAKKTPLHHALLNAFSKWNYGVTDGPNRRYAYKSATVMGRFNMGSRLKTLSAADLENHWRRYETFYYMGNGDRKEALVLAKLDYDAKNGVGSYQGCVQAEKYIAEKYFKGNVFSEDSTSGTSRHSFVWVYKLGRSAEEVNAAIDRLQEAIRADLKAINADISGFDIQGTCPIIEWEKIGGKLLMTKFVSGRLAKIPRTPTLALLNAAEVSLEEMDRLASAPPNTPAPLPTITRTWTEKEPKRQACYGGVMCEDDFADLDKLKNLYRRLIARFNGRELVKANRRYVVQEEHAAIIFAIMRFVYDHPHKDGTFPQKRAESLWNSAYDQGLIDCTWNHYRWKAVRDFLTKNGFIDWEDNTYFHYFGETKKGRACKWTVTAEFYGMLSGDNDSSDTTQGGDLGIHRINRGTGETLYPVLFEPIKGRINPNLFIRAAKAMEILYAA